MYGRISRISSLSQLLKSEKRALSQNSIRKPWAADLLNDMQITEEVLRTKAERSPKQPLHDLVSLMAKVKRSTSNRSPISEARVKLERNFQGFVPTVKKKHKTKSIRETSLPIIRGNKQVKKSLLIGIKLCNDPALTADLKRLVNSQSFI